MIAPLDTRGKSLWELIDDRATATPDARMSVDEAGRTLTFGEYRSHVLRTAAGFHDMGIGEESAVSWILPSRFETLYVVGALAYLGAVQNPILPVLRHREVGFITNQTGCELLLVPRTFRGFDYPTMAAEAANDVAAFVVDPEPPFADPKVLPPPASNAGDPVRWVLYTSGTTADPKGARHTDATLSAANNGLQWSIECTSDDRTAVVFPVTHVGGLVWLINALQTGVQLIMVETFGPDTPAFLAAHGVTCAGAGTAFWMAYLTAQRALPPGQKLFDHVRVFNGGGAPKPDTLHHELLADLGAPAIAGWGLTEAPISVMVHLDDSDEHKATTEGRPVPGVTLRVVSLDGVEVGPGVEGELRVKGPNVCHGYVDTSLNADAFDDEGWFRTGDLGVVSEHGYVRITGRLKDIIIRNGENISATEIENLIYTHPAVADVAVIGVPHATTGERCCAVIVLKSNSTLGFADLQNHLKAQKLAIYKLPEQLEFLDALPRNATGKVLKNVLRSQFAPA